MATLLILEDDDSLAKGLADEFADHGYQVAIASSISQIPKRPFDYALLDLRLGGEFGLDAIEVVKRENVHCRVVMLTGYGSVVTAVQAMKLGADDYLTKPVGFKQIERVLIGEKINSDEPELRLKSLSENEHEYIDYVLTKNQGNISKTAKELGLHRQSLQRKLKKYPS